MKLDIPADLWRFYLLYNRPETSDTSFEWEKFFAEINTHLVDNLGNLLNRVCVFLTRYYQKKININKATIQNIEPLYKNWIDSILAKEKEILKDLNEAKLRKALTQIFILAKLGNKLFQDKEPWQKVKENLEETNYILYLLVALLKDLAIMLNPYIPNLTEKIAYTLNLSDLFKNGALKNIGKWTMLQNHQIREAEILIKKLDNKKISEYKNKCNSN